MERKVPFEIGENYHAYTRGVERRRVFENPDDSNRFLLMLLLCNATRPVQARNILSKYQGEPLVRVFENEASEDGETIVHILGYSLMPNHVHLILKEKIVGGVSKFMLKLMTAYSMYFNTKYERTGPLFTRPFRSRHIDSDEYMRWLFAYIHLNPLDMFQPGWKEAGLIDAGAAGSFLRSYRFSSFPDYCGEARPESVVIKTDSLPFDIQSLGDVDDLLGALSDADVPFFTDGAASAHPSKKSLL